MRSRPIENAKSNFPGPTDTDCVTSDSAGWRSLRVSIREQPLSGEPIHNLGLLDPAIFLLLNESFKLEFHCDGRSRGIRLYYRGTGSLLPAGHTCLVRPHFEDQKCFASLILILPQDIVTLVAQRLGTTGTTGQDALSCIPFLDDPSIMSFGSSVVAALKSGAPEFYAQAAAQWLAAHLLLGPSRGHEWHSSLARERISDHRLVRVLEYIDAHLSDPLDLRVLSREAGISRFHFAALFRKAMGTSPHRHVLHLRMQAARAMLRHTDKSVFEIALSCGFVSASHFTGAFRRHFSQSPTEVRSSQQ